jgi:hypothetical protein
MWLSMSGYTIRGPIGVVINESPVQTSHRRPSRWAMIPNVMYQAHPAATMSDRRIASTGVMPVCFGVVAPRMIIPIKQPIEIKKLPVKVWDNRRVMGFLFISRSPFSAC